LLKKLADHPGCNCTFNLKLVDDGKYGVLEDGQWNGMIGEVLRGVRIAVVLRYLCYENLYSPEMVETAENKKLTNFN